MKSGSIEMKSRLSVYAFITLVHVIIQAQLRPYDILSTFSAQIPEAPIADIILDNEALGRWRGQINIEVLGTASEVASFVI
jgi:hypothetical protein